MSESRSTVAQEIRDKEYHISLDHNRIRLLDRALKRINAGTGMTTNGGNLLFSLAVIMHNYGLNALTDQEALSSVLNLLDTDTLFAILPVAIDEKITEKDIKSWLFSEDSDRISPLSFAMWLSEAALASNIVRLTDEEDSEEMDPRMPLAVIRLLRGSSTDQDTEYLESLKKASASSTENESPTGSSD